MRVAATDLVNQNLRGSTLSRRMHRLARLKCAFLKSGLFASDFMTTLVVLCFRRAKSVMEVKVSLQLPST